MNLFGTLGVLFSAVGTVVRPKWFFQRFLKGKLGFLGFRGGCWGAPGGVWEPFGGALGDDGDPPRSRSEILSGSGVFSGAKMRVRGSKNRYLGVSKCDF